MEQLWLIDNNAEYDMLLKVCDGCLPSSRACVVCLVRMCMLVALPERNHIYRVGTQGDQTNKVVYGAMEHGQALRPNEDISALLRQVGQRLMIAEREVEAIPIKAPAVEPSVTLPASDKQAVPCAEDNTKEAETNASTDDHAPDTAKMVGGDSVSGISPEVGQAASTSASASAIVPAVSEQADGGDDAAEHPGTVMITGAVEMKGIIGSDNRSYLLDVARLTPRDANWVRGEKGTGVYNEWMRVR